MVYKTEGVIIKKRDLKDADRLLTIYTKDLGKISVKAKSVKKSQAKLKGHLELFVHSYLMIVQGKSLDIVTGAETIENYPFLRHDLKNLSAAYYFTELIDKLIVCPEKDSHIWQLLIVSLQELNKKDIQIEPLVSLFENKLLQFLGYHLDNQQEDPLAFIQYTLGEKINAKRFLKAVLSSH